MEHLSRQDFFHIRALEDAKGGGRRSGVRPTLRCAATMQLRF